MSCFVIPTHISSSIITFVGCACIYACVYVSFAEMFDLYDSDDCAEDSDDCVVPTRKYQNICKEEALQLSFSSEHYPEYLGIEGPRDHNNPQTSNPSDFLF